MKWIGDWKLDSSLGILIKDGKQVRLTPLSLNVLKFLVARPGELVSAETLLEEFWRGSFSSDNAVQKAISEIRHAFDDDSRASRYIQTVPKRGYILLAAVREVDIEKEQPGIEATGDASKPFAAYRGQESYTFVCYAHKDKAEVYPQLAWLHDQGLNIWYDEGISPGSMWRAELAERITGSNRLIYFVSEASVASEHCDREINFALDCKRPILPIYLQDVQLSQMLQMGLTGIQAIHKFEIPAVEYLQKLQRALRLDSTPVQPIQYGVRQSQTESAFPVSMTKKIWPRLAVAVVALMLVTTGVYYFQSRVTEPLSPVTQPTTETVGEQPSIAVIPIENLGTDNAYLAAGLYEDIYLQLSKIDQLTVISKASTTPFANTEISTKEIAKQLKVSHILNGSVRQSGDKVRVSMQLADGTSGEIIWVNSYNRIIEDIFSLQSEIAQQVAGALKLTLDQATTAGISRVGTESLEAFELYSQPKDAKIEVNISRLKRILEIDPDYAAAHLTLATYFKDMAVYSGDLEFARLGLEHAKRGIKLDPSSSRRFYGLAAVLNQQLGRQSETDKYLREIESLDNFASENTTRMLMYAGRGVEAWESAQKLQRLDPLNPPLELLAFLNAVHKYNPDVSRRLTRRDLVRDPRWFTKLRASSTYWALGDYLPALEQTYSAWLDIPVGTLPGKQIIQQLTSIGDYESAESWINYYEEVNPETILTARIDWLEAQERYEELINYVSRQELEFLQPQYRFAASLAETAIVLRDNPEDVEQFDLKLEPVRAYLQASLVQDKFTWQIKDAFLSLAYVRLNRSSDVLAIAIVKSANLWLDQGGHLFGEYYTQLVRGLRASLAGDLDTAIQRFQFASQVGFITWLKGARLTGLQGHPDILNLLAEDGKKKEQLRAELRKQRPEILDPFSLPEAERRKKIKPYSYRES